MGTLGLSEPPGSHAEDLQPVERPSRLGILLLAILDIVIALGLLLTIRWLFQVRAFEIDKSFDVAEELEAALVGVGILTWAAAIGAAGFLLSAAGLLSGRRKGWLVALLWSILVAATGVGAVYGLPVIVYLLMDSTRSHFAPRDV
jgi:hypothetical protein